MQDSDKWKIRDIFELEEPMDRTVTLYITVPASFHDISKKYPEAEGATVSIKFPKNHPESANTVTRISPARETEAGTEDYDWQDIDLEYWIVEETLDRYRRNDWPEND